MKRGSISPVDFLSECDAEVQLKDFRQQLKNFYDQRYETPYGFLYAPADESAIEFIKVQAQEKRKLNPRLIIAIGIGGSYLGTKALYEALEFYQDKYIPLLFVDSFQSTTLHRASALIKEHAERNENVLVVVVTKSGTTLETSVNFSLLLNELCDHYGDTWNDLVVIVSDALSPLTTWAHAHRCMVLEIPGMIGGRFSVFTPVGLFPLAVAGIDIDELCAGATQSVQELLEISDCQHESLSSAALIFDQYQNGVMMYDLFLFDTQLESLGKWYRQLLAESLGKECENGATVTLVPSVSVGTLELHSVAQLMLGARPKIFTTFIIVEQSQNDINVTADGYELHGLQSATTLHALMNHAALATQKAYQQVGLPYDVIHLASLTPRELGQLMQFFMIQVTGLAECARVNAFDQPHVELYKKIMKQLM